MSHTKRVVVTGMGFRSPIGNTLDELERSLRTGVSGVHTMPAWGEIEGLRTGVAGLCTEGIAEAAVPRKYRRSMGRVALLAALATQDAVADADLSTEQLASPSVGVSFGSTAGSSTSQQAFLERVFQRRSVRGLLSSTYLEFMSHTCAANVALLLGVQGPVIASCTACTSGSQGVGFGLQQIRSGAAQVMITGGAEEMHFMDAGIFDIMRATSTRYNDRPDRTPRPFDAERDGLVVGEGAGCLVLEEYEHAVARGAAIYAEVLGFCNGSNGTHPTASDPAGIARAIRGALADAGLPPERIAYVNAHATATRGGDVAEAAATRDIFGSATPVSGLKGYMGHTLGACGALESIATILMMQRSFVAPTRNLTAVDPECAGLDHVMGEARELALDVAMNNNFAFGGINTSLVFGRDV